MNQLIESLRAVVGREAVLADADELIVYECDGLPQHKHLPRAVVFPQSTEETAEVMRILAREGVPFTPRGAGTGLSGGAVALDRAVVVELARMRKILKVDEANRLAVVQTGVVNSYVSRVVAPLGLHYVPDPSSQPTCTIGGNIAENAGGVHCLKYGTTTDHVMGIRVVLAGGEIVDLGGTAEPAGYDLRGVFVGSEGTFGIATEATLRLVPLPPTVRTLLAEFGDVGDASHAVSAVIAAGIIPAGLEMMDREIIRAVEASVFAAGLPLDAGAALLIELDGLEAGIDEEAGRVSEICMAHGAKSCRLARDENERKKLWAARKGAFGAIGRIAPDSMIQDAVVPRSKLPQIMTGAYQIAAKYQLRIANVFHAGDGNLHPLICFDSRSADEVRRVKEAGRELMEICVRAGGSITGEHGVGLDKRELLPLIFSEDDMEAMLRVRAAFDPSGLMNPGKIVPLLRGCGEASATRSVGLRPPITQAVSLRPLNKLNQETDSLLSDNLKSRLNEPNRTQANSLRHTTFDQDTAFDQLAGISGPQNVARTTIQGNGGLSASPKTIIEACELIKLASRERWTVVPAGNASWIEAGNPLGPVNLIVSTKRLNHIIQHEPADLVAITETGVQFSTFNRELGREKQWLPVDPAGHDQATIGAVVATGLSGPQQCGYGPMRGFVIGMKVILADGKLINTGGRVVKNVAGYDLCKLFTGSYGTLGLIVETNFKLRPRPEYEGTVIASGSIESLVTAGNSIMRAPLFPVALELVSPRKAANIGIDVEKAEAVLLVRFAGKQKTVIAQSDRALSLLANAYIANAAVVLEDENLWHELAVSQTRTENNLSWRASVPPAAVITTIRQKVPASSIWQAGIAHGRISVTQELRPESETSVRAIADIRNECERLGGSLIVDEPASSLPAKFGAWGDFGNSRSLMNRIKLQLDPDNLFSPGRF